MPSLRDTFNELMGELDYPMFVVTVAQPIAAEHGLRVGQFTFHRAKRIEAGHPA